MDDFYNNFDAEKCFIAENVDFYRNSFDNMYRRGTIAVWNWGAFFIPITWCFYRKMHLYGVAAFILQVLAYFGGFAGWFHIAEMFFFALFGTYIYKGYVDEAVYGARRKIRRIINSGNCPDYTEIGRGLSKSGGVDTVCAAIVFTALLFLCLGVNSFNIYNLLRRMYYISFGY